MSAPPNWSSALEFIWSQYRIWAATARAYQAQISSWRRRVLLFGIAGAAAGTLSSQLEYIAREALGMNPTKEEIDRAVSALAFISGGLLALATYFTTKILTPANEGGWLRARSVAEAFKREAYLLLAQAPPYDVPITRESLQQLKKVAREMGELEEEAVAEVERKRGLPAALLTVDGYIKDRVREQIKWYRDRAGEHRAVARRIKNFSLWLGAAAVLLGVSGARWAPAAAFVAVITTVTTSLASYLYAGRYQYLVVSYLATARKLEERILEWEYSGKTDDERKQFVLDCEAVFAAENSGWMAELSKRDQQNQVPPAQQPAALPPGQQPGQEPAPQPPVQPAPVNQQANGAGLPADPAAQGDTGAAGAGGVPGGEGAGAGQGVGAGEGGAGGGKPGGGT